MNYLYSFMIVVAFMALGELISTRTKAYIPSMFVAATCFMVGFWTFLPKDVVATASFNVSFVSICMTLLLVHLGTLMNLRKLLQQWKAVVVALCGITGTIIISMTIGRLLFDHNVVIAITPPLVGGVVATTLMSKALMDKGLLALAALPVAMFVMHSFAGYPVTSWCLKRESNRLLEDYRLNGPNAAELGVSAEATSERKKLIPPVPQEYLSPFLILTKLILVGMLAAWISGLTGGMLNQYIACLILGVVFCELGFLEEQALNKAGVFNWLILGLLAFIFAALSNTTPSSLGSIIVPILTLLGLGIIGMGITSMIVGKVLGMSKEMGFACALTALFGFPADYVITEEVCRSMGKTEEEYKYLMDIVLPKMLVGGFATVSIASVVIAGVFVNMLN